MEEYFYKVVSLLDDYYRVVRYSNDPDNSIEYCEGATVYQGRLSDCEAYIRLEKEGLL